MKKLTEICCECGNSVAFGSGKFVNRAIDFDTLTEKKMNGRSHPNGDFTCAECDSKR